MDVSCFVVDQILLYLESRLTSSIRKESSSVVVNFEGV
jgi:hypothetical protein